MTFDEFKARIPRKAEFRKKMEQQETMELNKFGHTVRRNHRGNKGMMIEHLISSVSKINLNENNNKTQQRQQAHQKKLIHSNKNNNPVIEIKIHLIDWKTISKRHHSYRNNNANNRKVLDTRRLEFVCEQTLLSQVQKFGTIFGSGKEAYVSYEITEKNGIVFILQLPTNNENSRSSSNNNNNKQLKSSDIIDSVRNRIQEAMNLTGLNGWLRGESGWKFASNFSSPQAQKSILDAMNKLQDVYKVLTTLYKMDTIRYLHNKKIIWRKSDDICDVNHDLRLICEIIIAIDKDTEERPRNDKPGLLETSKEYERWLQKNQKRRQQQQPFNNKKGQKNNYDEENSMSVRKRWQRITNAARNMMRTSQNDGPNCSGIQWAAHPPKNQYCLQVVTKEAQMEVIGNMICIIRNMFWGKSSSSSTTTLVNDNGNDNIHKLRGVGDDWYHCEKRRKSDWEENNKNKIKNNNNNNNNTLFLFWGKTTATTTTSVDNDGNDDPIKEHSVVGDDDRYQYEKRRKSDWEKENTLDCDVLKSFDSPESLMCTLNCIH